MTAPTEELTGYVERIVFRSEDTGYTVCGLRADGRRDPVTIVGTCPAIWEGENLRAEGTWNRHPQHGLQFQASAITCIAPTSMKGIERYLASGMIRGIGKVNAGRLVAAFGEETLRVIEKESKRLEEVEGIGPKRRKLIKDSWTEQKGIRDIMIFLQSHGVGTAHSSRIYRRYGQDAIAVITQNPYRLCADVWGIGFKTADGIAHSVGVDPESEQRARAGLTHVLQTLTDEGHCFCPQPELILQTEALLSVPTELIAQALNVEIASAGLILDGNRVYLPSLYEAERRIAARVRRLMATPASFKAIDIDKALPWIAKRIGFDFAPAQADALRMALSNKVSIITGGPGVGKTTIIKALVDVFSVRKLRLAQAAPTGRAAKRMSEATHHEAKTIHRLLKFLPRKGTFEYGADNPLPADVFILDETSMIDTALMRDFLEAVPNTAWLILVGDTDQLPSVGPGNVLRDLITSRAIPSCRLDTIFRQKSGGLIVKNAHHVNHGEMFERADPDALSDFYFVESQEPEDVIRAMLSLVRERIPRRFGFDPLRDVQVLTPMRRNALGSENLNIVLQEALNPTGVYLERFGRKYRKGDRVMQIRNNYDKEVFNGDIGHIASVDLEDQRITVEIDGHRIRYEFLELEELVHAYACSIHKSQGSEYPAVVILLTTQHFKLLQRNLLYTAITRGRELVCVVGSTKAVYIATQNNEIRQRRTALAERLAE